MNLSQIIIDELARGAGQGFPQSYGTLLDAVISKRPHTSNDEFCVALDGLCDAGLVTQLRVNRGGMWVNVYQPVNAGSINEDQSMSEQKNTLLHRLIVLHGPIAGGALAEKARATGSNIPAKNVPGLLETLVRKGDVIVRKYESASWYMTPNQAVEWDEDRAAAGGDREAHVMSAPEADETRTTDNAENVSDNLILAKKLQHREQDIEKMRALLASKSETIVQMEDQIEAMKQNAGIGGKLALLLIDSADLTEIEELDANCDPRIAQAAAMARIDHGHAARAVVVRIIGEAVRQVQWKAAA